MKTPRYSLALSVLLALSLAPALSPAAESPGQMKAKPAAKKKQAKKQIKNSGKMEVYSVNHEVVSPRDAASGQATGMRTHKPIQTTK